MTALIRVYPNIMRKIKIRLSPKPSKKEKSEKGKSGFMPVAARWIIERSNGWIKRCKVLVKNYEKKLKNPIMLHPNRSQISEFLILKWAL
jgi:hypothetical protein